MFRVLYQVYGVEIERAFFEQRAGRNIPDEHVRAEAVYFILDSSLETCHDQKRNDCGAESNGNGDDGNLMDRRRKRARLLAADSFGNEIRKVQNYGLTWQTYCPAVVKTPAGKAKYGNG
jgi:hypothetical protein